MPRLQKRKAGIEHPGKLLTELDRHSRAQRPDQTVCRPAAMACLGGSGCRSMGVPGLWTPSRALLMSVMREQLLSRRSLGPPRWAYSAVAQHNTVACQCGWPACHMRARQLGCCKRLRVPALAAQPAAHGKWKWINPMARCRFELVEPTPAERRYGEACDVLLARDVDSVPDDDVLPQYMRVSHVRPLRVSENLGYKPLEA